MLLIQRIMEERPELLAAKDVIIGSTCNCVDFLCSDNWREFNPK